MIELQQHSNNPYEEEEEDEDNDRNNHANDVDASSQLPNQYYSATSASLLHRAHGVLGWLFGSCAADPKGSIHRAWGISLIFVLLYFVLSVVESTCVCALLLHR
jgi:hypothetical protein